MKNYRIEIEKVTNGKYQFYQVVEFSSNPYKNDIIKALKNVSNDSNITLECFLVIVDIIKEIRDNASPRGELTFYDDYIYGKMIWNGCFKYQFFEL